MAAKNLVRITCSALLSQFLISACSLAPPLQYYIATGRTDEAVKEIDSGIEINSTNWNDYFSPIMVAAQLGNTVVGKKLLEKGVDLSHRSVNGVDALYIASANGKSEIVKLLLNYGADPNAVVPSEFPMKGKTSLMGAVNNLRASEKSGRPSRRLKGRLRVVQLLVGAGAEIDKRGDYGSTALELAITHDHPSMVEELIKLGADINQTGKYGKTPLTLAVRSGNLRAVEILLKNGADINQTDKDGKTALMIAYEFDEYYIAGRLKELAAIPKVDATAVSKEVSKPKVEEKKHEVYYQVEGLVPSLAKSTPTPPKNTTKSTVPTLKLPDVTLKKHPDMWIISSEGNMTQVMEGELQTIESNTLVVYGEFFPHASPGKVVGYHCRMTIQTKLENPNGFLGAWATPESIPEGSYIRVIPENEHCGTVTMLLSPGIIDANFEQFFIAVMLDGKLTDWEFNMLNQKRLEEERAE